MVYPRFTGHKYIVYIYNNFKTYDGLEDFCNKIAKSKINVVNFAFANPDNNLNIIPDDGSIMKQWVSLSDDQRTKLKNILGETKLLCSWGGSGSGGDVIKMINTVHLPSLANNMVNFTTSNLFDGIDIDYEIHSDKNTQMKFGDLGIEIRKINNDILLTYAPEADVMHDNGFTEIAKKLGDGLDWYNIQYYNAGSLYDNGMKIFIDDDPGRGSRKVAILELMDGTIPGSFKIPPEKLVPGKCTDGPSCYSQWGNNISKFTDIVKQGYDLSKNSEYTNLSSWFPVGGVFVWEYLSDTYPFVDENEIKKINTDLLQMYNDVDKILTNSPIDDQCSGVDCGNYGKCKDGQCVCTYGFTGSKCENPPSCSSLIGLSDDQDTSSMSDDQWLIWSGVGIGILGICVFIMSIGIFDLAFFRKNKNKKIGVIVGGVLFFTGLTMLLVGSLSNNNNNKKYNWKIGGWGNCNNGIQTRNVECVDMMTGTIVLDNNCSSPKPVDTKDCNVLGYNCTDKKCTKVYNGNAQYKNQSDCESVCGGIPDEGGFNCVNNKCEWVNTGAKYKNWEDCYNKCDNPPLSNECGKGGIDCQANYICMQEDGSTGTDSIGMCVPCSKTPPTNKCVPPCANGGTCTNSKCVCVNDWTGPACNDKPDVGQKNRRMVTYIEGWGKDLVLGTPENYTHAVLAFAVPYHFWGGYCSGNCSLWLSWYFDSGGDSNNVKNAIKTLKQNNPNMKVLLAFGGWNLNHMDWAGPNGSGKGCNMVCNPPSSVNDDPACYGPGGSMSGIYPECPAGKPDDVYNCKFSSDNLQPSDYCYGPHAKEGRAKYVGDQIINIVNTLGLDGFDFDLEDTCDFFKSESPALQFMVDLTKYIRSKSNMLLTQAPINAYVITDPSLNSENDGGKCSGTVQPFVNCAKNYTKYLEQIIDDIDYISVQFYNGAPYSSTQPENVIKAYDQIVKFMNGRADKVVVGMCSFAEPGTCGLPNGCGDKCPDGNERADKLIKPLMEKYGNNFGGVMQWAANGDLNGSFSGPMLKAMGK